jgi:hypothetical protein
MLRLARLNVDAQKELSAALQIRQVPTLLGLVGGKVRIMETQARSCYSTLPTERCRWRLSGRAQPI